MGGISRQADSNVTVHTVSSCSNLPMYCTSTQLLIPWKWKKDPTAASPSGEASRRRKAILAKGGDFTRNQARLLRARPAGPY